MASAESLSAPKVKPRPDRSMWIERVMEEARSSSFLDKRIMAIVSERRAGCRPRVLELLGQRMIHPDEIYFRSAQPSIDKDIVVFKRTALCKMLDEYGEDISMVRVWDDEKEIIKNLRDVCKRRKTKFEGTLVIDKGKKGFKIQ